MLQSSVTFIDNHDLKNVPSHWCGLTEKTDLAFANNFQITFDTLFIKVTSTGEYDFMRHTAGNKFQLLEITHLHRVINQLVIVFYLP